MKVGGECSRYISVCLLNYLWYLMLCQWSWLNMRFKQHKSNSISTGIISVRHTLLPVFYSSSRWSQWRLRPGAVPDSRTLPSLCYLHLLFILSTWQPARQHCAIGLHSRHSQSLFFYFHSSIAVCASVSLFPVLLLSRPSIFFSPSVLLLSFHPALTSVRPLKIETAEKLEVKDPLRHSSGNLRGNHRRGEKRGSTEGQL